MQEYIEGSKVSYSSHLRHSYHVSTINITGQTVQFSFGVCFKYTNLLLQDNDKAGVSLHNGLWAPVFALGAGTSMYVTIKLLGIL